MIFGTDKKELQKQYDEKYKEYASLINTPNVEPSKKSAVKSELKHLENQLNQLKGSNEKEREDELHNKRQRKNERLIQNYDAFKSKYKPISNFNMAVNRLMKAITYYKNDSFKNEYENDKVIMKVK